MVQGYFNMKRYQTNTIYQFPTLYFIMFNISKIISRYDDMFNFDYLFQLINNYFLYIELDPEVRLAHLALF